MVSKGVDIAWEDFSIVRPLSKSEAKIKSKQGLSTEPIPVINNMSGTIERGTFTTILGPSGSGKTTFLNFLSNRIHFLKGLKYTGHVYINGRRRETLDFNSVAGYVMQDEILLEHLKVRETLEFSASFKMSKDKVKLRVDDIVNQLGLKSCEHSFVGGFTKKGISGGEKKRVAIGVELLTDPSILFLDEPTTGLDSYNSETLIGLLNELAKTGVTVIATIHQPNSYIFALFDRMLLLGGNEVVYHGSAEESLDYFKSIGFECPEFNNPAEFLLELITDTDEHFKENIEKIKQASVIPDLQIVEKELPSLFERESAGFFKETGLLISRSSLNITRNYISFIFKCIANICFLLLVMAAFYMACDSKSVTSISDRGGIIFIILVYMSFIASNSITSLSTDKVIFLREQASKTYSPGAFYLSKLLFDIPFDQILVIFMGFLLYLVVGLRLDEPHPIFFFVFVLYILDLTTRGWGSLLLIALPNLEAASAATPFMIILQLLFAGLFINYKSIPNYLIWLEYASMFKYSWSAIMSSELEGRDDDYWTGCTEDSETNDPMCDPLDFYSITISKWHNVLALSCIAIITHFFAYLYLNLLAKKFRVN